MIELLNPPNFADRLLQIENIKRQEQTVKRWETEAKLVGVTGVEDRVRLLESEIESTTHIEDRVRLLESHIERTRHIEDRVRLLESQIERTRHIDDRVRLLESQIERTRHIDDRVRLLESHIERTRHIEDRVRILESHIERTRNIDDRVRRLESEVARINHVELENIKNMSLELERLASLVDVISGNSLAIYIRLKALEETLEVRTVNTKQKIRRRLTLSEQAANVKVGSRVKRGPRWRRGSLDGTPPGPGTVCQHWAEYHVVQVLWDSGNYGRHRMGYNGIFDIQLDDEYVWEDSA
ncbi:uncharacterized protein LOC131948631 [Physella acuta]|uniref:uncharacterized protein LOC131948631 n=1 Tax=Physella acuta TaxID=109671 RepID=UPI0027DB741B|nr:uncharacterized protein LOC131948631 [Physella acuta]